MNLENWNNESFFLESNVLTLYQEPKKKALFPAHLPGENFFDITQPKTEILFLLLSPTVKCRIEKIYSNSNKNYLSLQHQLSHTDQLVQLESQQQVGLHHHQCEVLCSLCC